MSRDASCWFAESKVMGGRNTYCSRKLSRAFPGFSVSLFYKGLPLDARFWVLACALLCQSLQKKRLLSGRKKSKVR